jgi:ribonuclease HII
MSFTVVGILFLLRVSVGAAGTGRRLRFEINVVAAGESRYERRMPDFTLERACRKSPVVGVDEAGRGPLAGPVVAAAVILDERTLPDDLACRIDDSKAVARDQRAELFALLPLYALIGVGEASVEEIDALNILQATLLAMRRAVERLPVRPAVALVDGNKPPDLRCQVRTVVAGDSLSLSIAAASIVAKVTRDRVMTELARAHPGYGWEHNAGYGTAEHHQGIVRLGVTAHHRRSFRPISEVLNLTH